MIQVGIDLGASGLRIASDQSGTPALLSHRFTTERMSWLADTRKLGISQQDLSYRIVSLKRMLDFDRAIPLTTEAINSLDYLANILRLATQDCGIPEDDGSVNCILAVPPSFSQRQRSSLKTSAEQAGYLRVKLVDDTLAALLTSRRSLNGASAVLAFALGASSFSCALYRSHGSGFKIVAQEGDRDLGGDNIDSAFLAYIFNSLLRDGRLTESLRSLEFQHCLLSECERLKLGMAAGQSPVLSAERPFHPRSLPSGFPSLVVPQEVFEESAKRLIASTMALTERTLEQKGATAPDVVLLVGKATKLPLLRLALERRLGVPLRDAEESAVACGAVLYGKLLQPKEWEKGINQENAHVVAEQAVSLKAEKSRTQSTKVDPMAKAYHEDLQNVGSAARKARPGPKSHSLASGMGKKKVGRNDPCPCGSGQKYKKCCGK